MDDERIEFLEQYILRCIQQGRLSWGDFASGAVVDKFFGVVARDTKVVVKKLSIHGAGKLVQIGAMKLMEFAASKLSDASKKKRG